LSDTDADLVLTEAAELLTFLQLGPEAATRLDQP
jgi:hypothetical protein